MLQLFINAIVTYTLISHIDKKRDGAIEEFTIITFIAVPALTILLLTMGGGLLGLPSYLILPFYLLYFIVPQLMCRFMFDYSWGIASLYGGIVLGVHFMTSVAVLILLGGNG